MKTLPEQKMRARTRSRSRRVSFESGFTLLELMIVVTIILILIGMAAARYDRTVQHANEAVLKHNLQTIRDVIDQYTVDKQAAPNRSRNWHGQDIYAGFLWILLPGRVSGYLNSTM